LALDMPSPRVNAYRIPRPDDGASLSGFIIQPGEGLGQT
jgi:hypothetical protein